VQYRVAFSGSVQLLFGWAEQRVALAQVVDQSDRLLIRSKVVTVFMESVVASTSPTWSSMIWPSLIDQS
jgi:hypothetical protein